MNQFTMFVPKQKGGNLLHLICFVALKGLLQALDYAQIHYETRLQWRASNTIRKKGLLEALLRGKWSLHSFRVRVAKGGVHDKTLTKDREVIDSR